jgi:DNA polymerase-3 subunit alpha
VGDALASSNDLAKKMSEMGGQALALTDHDTLAGAIEHQKACSKFGVKPIFGVEITRPQGQHLTLLAQSAAGYKNLLSLMDTQKTWGDLGDYSDDVICLSGDLSSGLSRAILRMDLDELRGEFGKLLDIYGDRLYLEAIDHGLREQKRVREGLDMLSTASGTQIVETNDVHYLNEEDALAHAIFMCSHMKRRVNVNWALYHGIKSAYLNDLGESPVAKEIADRCNFELDIDVKPMLPEYPIPASYKGEDFLMDISVAGLKSRIQQNPEFCKPRRKEYLERLRYEHGVIKKMGYVGYYLIVWDFIIFARQNDIVVGPGRGSGAGSLMAYALGITNVDPIKHGLLFERFLNPDRVSMPDFDIDFSNSRRGEVVDYVRSKYGRDNVTGIVTYGSLKSRSAWKAVSRAVDISPVVQNNVSKGYLPPTTEDTTIAELMEAGALDELLSREKDLVKPMELASQCQGAYSQLGVHAAGVIISPTEVRLHAPVSDGLCQFSYTDAESVGLVKFDFLGLKELDVIKYASSMIGGGFDIEEIQGDDQATYKLLASGKTSGIFQVAGEGLSGLMVRLMPTKFQDVVAAIALYRPGPLGAGMVDDFVERRHGRQVVEYLHADLAEVLEETYGVIVYQEQVMKIAQILGGYSLGQADILRRAMGKKKVEEMNQQRDVFMGGASVLGYEEDIASEAWRQMATFAGYGFNKSHSVSYAKITYQTAWLKAHFPAELMSAQMEVRCKDFDKVSELILDAPDHGLTVHEPDVQKAKAHFQGSGSDVYVGLVGIHQLSDRVAEELEAEAPFADVLDLVERVSVQPSDLKALCCAGALDSLIKASAGGGDLRKSQVRASLVAQSQKMVKVVRKDQSSPQMALLSLQQSGFKFDPRAGEPWSPMQMLEFEYEYLERYRTAHPAVLVRKQYVQEFVRISDWKVDRRDRFWICGIVREFETQLTSTGNKMAFINVDDDSGNMRIAVFGEQLDFSKMKSKDPLAIKVRKNIHNGEMKAAVDSW